MSLVDWLREKWQLYKLNRPFVWLEKKIIEPLDSWSDRSSVFRFFSKVSPVIEALVVLAIPFVIFYYENQREERQIKFEENLISKQAEVRRQQAVRDYLFQITTIYLGVKEQDEIKDNKELKKLLEATTLAIFDELSVSEDFRSRLSELIGVDWEVIERDQKGEVINFLSNLGWIISSNDEKPLLSLRESNLSQADLEGVNLWGANLGGANLWGTNLGGANLARADLRGAILAGTYLRGAILRGADLGGAYLGGAYLVGANLAGANLAGADLERVTFCETTMPDGTINNSNCDIYPN